MGQDGAARAPRGGAGRAIGLLAGVALLLLVVIGVVVLRPGVTGPGTTPTVVAQVLPVTATLPVADTATVGPTAVVALATLVEGSTATVVALPSAPTGVTVAPTDVAGNTADFSPDATLAALRGLVAPGRDLYTLTGQVKLHLSTPITRTLDTPPRAWQMGDQTVFQVGDTAAGSYYPVTATLRLVTAHVYWWTDDAGEIDVAALRTSADHFESRVYPGDTTTFGQPAATGADRDPHINVLNTQISGAAGYFSAADMYTQLVNPYSNARKMIYAGLDPGGTRYEALLAHEFQHMIHWNVHPNQNVWINEGMAELAMKINGYDTGGPESVFMSAPDVQLNDWATPPDAAVPHYGAAYLFMNYLYGRYGADLIRGILQAPGADTEAVDQAFAAQGKPDTFESVFSDWIVANWVDKVTTAPRYSYPKFQVSVQARATLTPGAAVYSGTLHQQAADYLVVPGTRATGGLTVTFDGDATVPLIPVAAHSGRALWWSGRGDVAAPALTRDLDLRAVKTATLTYAAWYDVEDGYDYGYVELSSDSGQTWSTLAAPGTTAANPNGNNLGHGYTGHSGGGSDTSAWVQEQVDLSPYAGKAVQVRFQYVTDDGYNADGFAIDDIAVPEIGYRDDAETPGAGGWQAQGWVHVTPTLPERFIVQIITYAANGTPSVTAMPLDAANHGSLTFPATSGRAVLVVAPLAPQTTQVGHYRVAVRLP